MKIKKYRWDIIVISSLLLASFAAFLALNLMKTEGKIAVVEINFEKYAEYPLSQDGVFSLNGGTNTLVIENGEAYLSHSDCRDHRCEREKIHYVGQTVVCLPNRVSVTIRGEQTDEDPDLIS